ncbi:MAG: twin-arginine translocase TatA/TatE family subunit [Bacteroidaceae bacterium]|nr:twin-arginine translocase TatA/TatE family subunit [Bacteroidaceae bacterium]
MITLLFGLGMPEVLALVFIALLLFGAKRIPELMKSMGKGVRSFKEGMNEIDKEINSDVESSSKHSEEEKKD